MTPFIVGISLSMDNGQRTSDDTVVTAVLAIFVRDGDRLWRDDSYSKARDRGESRIEVTCLTAERACRRPRVNANRAGPERRARPPSTAR